MKKALIGHQGDIFFREISAIPKEAIRIANRPLAFGDSSGHQHCLTGPEVKLFIMPDGSFVASVGKDGARLQHVHESHFQKTDWVTVKELQKADHGSTLLPKRIYEFYIKNNYNPYSKLMEKVID